MASVKDLVAAMKGLVEEAEVEAMKVEDKENKSAGGRLRKKMQEVKKVSQDVRIEVMARIKAAKKE